MSILRTRLVLSLALWCTWASFLLAWPTAQAFSVVPPYCRRLPPPYAQSKLFVSSDGDGGVTSNDLTHSDIEWRLRPPEGTRRIDRLKIKLGANILRLWSKLKGMELPPVLCPRGGRALLEAYYKEPGQRKKKIARFGFTTARGPSSPEIDKTIVETYNINPPPLSATIAAIIYMFVEPDYRGRNVGALALDVISTIQSVQVVDFTVLVADDNGSGGLVRWYEEHGYSKAPLLQKILGSPHKENGVAMISPVKSGAGFFDQCVIKWW
mmetsp:Transcript_5220/g.13056  ORF Transcript_5220/g.13056 Transcript_5220/m.13056 type:complete len:267 (+) Transcript_5220:106-906(+)